MTTLNLGGQPPVMGPAPGFVGGTHGMVGGMGMAGGVPGVGPIIAPGGMPQAVSAAAAATAGGGQVTTSGFGSGKITTLATKLWQ